MKPLSVVKKINLARLSTLGQYLLSRYLVASSVPLLVAQGVTALLGLGRNTLLTQSLSKADYGSLSYLMNWLTLIGLVGLSGMDVAIAQYVAKGYWEAIRVGIRLRLLLATGPIAIILAFEFFGTRIGLTPMAPGVWLVSAVFFPSAYVLAVISSILGALKQFRTLAVFSFGESLVFLCAAGLGLWLWPARPIQAIVFFQWLFLSLLHAGFWLRLRRPQTESLSLTTEQRQRFLRFGTHMTALTAMSLVSSRLGAVLLGTITSLESLADYTVAELFFDQLRALMNIYTSVSSPRLIALPSPVRWRQLGRELRLIGPLFLAFCLIIGLLLTLIIPWLFSARYVSSIPYLWALLLAFVCSVPGSACEMYFRIEEAERPLYQMRLASNVSAIVLPPALLLSCGPLGVPLGRAAAYLLYSASGLLLYYRQCPETVLLHRNSKGSPNRS